MKQRHRAQQIWQILSAVAEFKTKGEVGEPGLITYGELAKRMGYSSQAGRTLAVPLGMLARYCESQELPSLNAIVVNLTGEPGSGVIFDPAVGLDKDQQAVLEEKWFLLRTPKAKAIRKAARWLG